MASYVRFQTALPCPVTGWPLGIFYAADHLRAVDEYELVFRPWVEDVFDWFNSNLTVPPASEFDCRAVFWFLSEAQEVVAQAWSLATAYRDAGISVRLQRTTLPGRIIYRDKHQIAAIPYWPFGRGPPTAARVATKTDRITRLRMSMTACRIAAH